MQELVWISERVVVAIHRRQLAEHGGLEEIGDEGLLQSALSRPKNLLAYSQSSPNLASLAAAYAYEIFQNHPFVDGEYINADEIISAALKLLESRETKLQELKTKIAVGTEQIAQDKVTDGELVFAKL